MAVDIDITYKGSSIATMSASGTKTLETEGKYCEDDIVITYTKSGGGGGSYNVTISLANPFTPSAFESFTIYEAVLVADGSATKGQQIGTIASATGSTQVTVTSPANGIVCELKGSYVVAPMATYDYLLNGPIGLYWADERVLWFAVAGDGTIEISNIDWDD